MQEGSYGWYMSASEGGEPWFQYQAPAFLLSQPQLTIVYDVFGKQSDYQLVLLFLVTLLGHFKKVYNILRLLVISR
jgi:hypothetical protein